MGSRPNIVFITTDHQRFDSLFMQQCGLEVTPHLNEFARESCVFGRAYNSCPLCVPARTALATGKYPTHNGVVYNDWEGRRAGNHKPIHQYLSEMGYRVAHTGIDHIKVKPGLQERVNFQLFADQSSYRSFLEDQRIVLQSLDEAKTKVSELRNGSYEQANYSNTHSDVWQHPLPLFMDVYFTDQAVGFMEDQTDLDAPYALFVSLWAPHPPLTVPEPYASLFNKDELRLPELIGIPAENEPAYRRRGVAAQLAEGVTMEQWRSAWAAHLGLTRLADDCIGRIIAALKKMGVYEETIILFMSDHGDHLGQHGMYQKMEMYEQAIRVPLIMKVPQVKAQDIQEIVSHLDILPTVLDLLELEIPGDLDGISLKKIMTDQDRLHDRAVFSQYSGNPTIGDIRRAVITSQYKYVYDPNDGDELYDLLADPLETRNLAAQLDYAEIKIELFERIKQWGDEHRDWVF